MDFSVEALQGLASRTAEFATLDNGLQLAVIAFALVVGGIVFRLIDRKLAARLDRGGLTMPHEHLLRTTRRLVFPLATLVLVIAGRTAFELLGYRNGLMDIAAQLLVALAVIRMHQAHGQTRIPSSSLREKPRISSTLSFRKTCSEMRWSLRDQRPR